jgi:hypothetical protein
MTTFIHDDAPCRRHNDSVILSTCFAFLSASIFHPNMKPNCLDAAFARSAISFFTPRGRRKYEMRNHLSSFISSFRLALLTARAEHNFAYTPGGACTPDKRGEGRDSWRTIHPQMNGNFSSRQKQQSKWKRRQSRQQAIKVPAQDLCLPR